MYGNISYDLENNHIFHTYLEGGGDIFIFYHCVFIALEGYLTFGFYFLDVIIQVMKKKYLICMYS